MRARGGPTIERASDMKGREGGAKQADAGNGWGSLSPHFRGAILYLPLVVVGRAGEGAASPALRKPLAGEDSGNRFRVASRGERRLPLESLGGD